MHLFALNEINDEGMFEGLKKHSGRFDEFSDLFITFVALTMVELKLYRFDDMRMNGNFLVEEQHIDLALDWIQNNASRYM